MLSALCHVLYGAPGLYPLLFLDSSVVKFLTAVQVDWVQVPAIAIFMQLSWCLQHIELNQMAPLHQKKKPICPDSRGLLIMIELNFTLVFM